MTEEELEEAAARISAKIISQWSHLLTEDEIVVVRSLIEMELLIGSEAQFDLRQLLGDPELQESAAVARQLELQKAGEGES